MNSAADRAIRGLLDESRWSEALDCLEVIPPALLDQAVIDPAKAEHSWQVYGRLVNAVTAAIHPVVTSISENPPAPLERAMLCWRMQRLLRAHRELPVEEPAWLAVLESQLIKDGALFWRELIGQEPEAEEKALDLFECLAEQLDPCPPWVSKALQELESTALARPLRLELMFRPGEPLHVEAPGQLGLNLAAVDNGPPSK